MKFLQKKISWPMSISIIALELAIFFVAFIFGIYKGININSKISAAGDINVPAGSYYKYNNQIFGMAQTDKSNYFLGGAGNLTMEGLNNTAFGVRALNKNTTGVNNTVVGVSALGDNTTGANNDAFGLHALMRNTRGDNNAAFGMQALGDNTTGRNNTAFGMQALGDNTTGSDNAAFGFQALNNIIGNNNVAIGMQAFTFLESGNGNVAIGSNAGIFLADSKLNKISNKSVYLGSGTRPSNNNNTNEIIIGYDATGAGSNTVTLGNDSIIKTLLKGNVGIGTSNPMSKLHILNAVPGTGQLVIDGNSGKLYLGRDANIGWINVDSSESLELRTNNIGKLNILANGNIGIGTNNPITKLDVQGAIRTAPTNSSQCNNNTKGSIYYNSNDNHFYGCNGTTWKQLDNN